MNTNKKVSIIGGGASGIFSAILLKKYNSNIDVTIYEAQNRIGKKILQTGNGKCNISNINLDISNYNTNVIENVLHEFDTIKLITILEELGLRVRIDEEGRVYPYSEKASTVLDIFLYWVEKLNIEVKTNCVIKDLIKEKDMFVLKSDSNSYKSDFVIVCTGGKSGITFNNTSYNLLTCFGHNVTMLEPSLCALKTKEYTKHLSGVKVKCLASIYVNSVLKKETYGEVLFKEDGLSGIAIFILSQFYSKKDKCIISLDLYPELDEEKLNGMLYQNNNLENNMIGYFPKMVNQDLIKRCGNDKIGKIIKNYCFEITGSSKFEHSQVTKGGLRLEEVNECFESKLVNNLYIAGEALDVDGTCGGYNLHFAFASSYHIVKNIINK